MHPKIKWKGKERDMLEFAKTPPKGWNSWDVYGASVTEEEVKRNADIMAEKLKKYGWNYVVVDIQWYEPGAESAAYRKFADLKIDEYSRVLPAENRFPSSADGVGFAPLAEYVHQLGLKFGIHILRGIPRQAVHGRMNIKGTDKTADQIAINSICPWNCMLLGELISLKLMISHIQRFTEIHIERKLKGFERLSTKRDGTLYFPFRRDRQDCRMEVFFKKLQICGD